MAVETPPTTTVAKKRWKLALLLAAALAFTVVAVVQLSLTLRSDDNYTGPFSIADEFISRLKHGEDVFPQRDVAERMGYAAAHEMLDDAARERLPFEAFYQLFLLRQNEHGLIVRSRQCAKGVVRGGASAWAEYQLTFERDEQRRGTAHEEPLRLQLARNAGTWRISECSFLPSGTEGR